jgi:hypothetical protein
VRQPRPNVSYAGGLVAPAMLAGDVTTRDRDVAINIRAYHKSGGWGALVLARMLVETLRQ